MKQSFRRNARTRLTYANVAATAALVCSLGGTAWAAATLTGRDIQDHSLGTVELSSRAMAALTDSSREIRSKLISVDGAGSRIDADRLDGRSSAAFASANPHAANIVWGNIGPDGGGGFGVLDASSNHAGTANPGMNVSVISPGSYFVSWTAYDQSKSCAFTATGMTAKSVVNVFPQATGLEIYTYVESAGTLALAEAGFYLQATCSP